MFYYYKYDFISPESLYATIKEELSSYFDTGAVDDIMFGNWTDACLRKLGKTSYSVKETALYIDTFKSSLPEDFYKVREAWACVPGESVKYSNPSSVYTECITSATLIDSNIDPRCSECQNFPNVVRVNYKYNDTYVFNYYGRSHLLRPGTIKTKDHCTSNCANIYSTSLDTFDIHGNKFTTNFRSGLVYLVYYAKTYDESGYQLIPDDIDIINYIDAYIRYKLFYELLNSSTDETFNVLRYKYEKAEREKDTAWVLARTSSMRETVQRKQLAKKRQLRANQMYELADARPKRR